MDNLFVKKYNAAIKLPKAAIASTKKSACWLEVTSWINAATRKELAIKKETSLACCESQMEPLRCCLESF